MQRGVTDRAPDHALFSPSFEVTPQSHSSVRYQMSRGSAPSDRQLPSPYLLFLIRRLSFFIPGASSSQFTHITFSRANLQATVAVSSSFLSFHFPPPSFTFLTPGTSSDGPSSPSAPVIVLLVRLQWIIKCCSQVFQCGHV
jgi:hypothetical protein